jgi:hypothetical protein
MSITLKLQHDDGIRLRQQSAAKVERLQTEVDGKQVDTPLVIRGTEWRFEKDDLKQDEDLRKLGADGKHLKLGTYTAYITAGLKNLVIERKGIIKSLDFRNSSVRNQMKIQVQKLVEVKKGKDGSAVKEWKNDGPAQYIPANTFGGAFVGDGQRAVIDEMPT